MAESTPQGRTFRGQSQEERVAQRRRQLLDAGLALFGSRGFHAVSVRDVCAEAKLTERYFYESFSNSEELLVASFQAVMHFLLGELEKAGDGTRGSPVARTRAMLNAYYEALKLHPQSARVFLVEISGVSPAVDQALEASLRALGELLARTLDPHGKSSAADEPLLRAGVVGGIIHIALSWIASGYSQPIHEVVDTAMRLCLVLRGR